MKIRKTSLALIIALSCAACAHNMKLLQRWPYGACQTIEVDGNVAYIGHGGVLSKVSFEKDARLIKEVVTDGKVNAIRLFDNKLYINCGKAGLKVYDTDLTLLEEDRSFSVGSGMNVNEDLILTRSKTGELTVYDRKSLNNRGELSLKASAGFLELIGNDLILTSGKDSETSVFTVATLSPQGEVMKSEEFKAPDGQWKGAYVKGDAIYVQRQVKAYNRKLTGEAGKKQGPGVFYLDAFSIDGASRTKKLREYGPFASTPHDFVVQGGRVYSATMTDVYAADLENPNKSWRRAYGNGISSLAASDSMVFMGFRKATPNGVRTITLENDGKVVETASYVHECNTEGVYIANNLCYVAWNRDGLHILDISDPENIEELSWLDMPNPKNLAEDIWVTGTDVYIAEGTGLAIVDAADPRNPKIHKYIMADPVNMANWIEGVRRVGDYLYVAAHSKLRIFDVSDPANANQVSELKVREAKDLAVRDGLCHIAEWTGYSIVDVKDPLNPKELAFINFGPRHKVKGVDVELKDNHAFVSCGPQGVHIIDFTDPKDPFIANTVRTPPSIQGVEILGDYLYVCTVYKTGILKYDISDVMNPVLVDTFDTPGASLNVKIRDGVMAVADFTCGVVLLKP
ncbi:LVIVD repeat-containing protein [Candidatus Hydrogenedentota bacterium]